MALRESYTIATMAPLSNSSNSMSMFIRESSPLNRVKTYTNIKFLVVVSHGFSKYFCLSLELLTKKAKAVRVWSLWGEKSSNPSDLVENGFKLFISKTEKKDTKREYLWHLMLHHHNNKAKYIEFNQCQWDTIGSRPSCSISWLLPYKYNNVSEVLRKTNNCYETIFIRIE